MPRKPRDASKLPKNHFRHPETYAWITSGLFWETAAGMKEYAIYTLKEYDYDWNGKTYKSLRKCYLECNDPTEYVFANEYFGGWEHWQRIQKSKKYDLVTAIESWRKELAVKLMSTGVKQMIEHSFGEKGMQASKWLTQQGWLPDPPSKRTKDQKKKEAELIERTKSEVEDDLARISIN